MHSLVKEVHKALDSGRCTYNVNYVFLTTEKEIKVHLARACFASFQTVPDVGIVKARLILHWRSLLKDEPHDLKLFLDHAKWVIFKSPWRSAFKNKHKNIWRDGLSLNTNLPHSFLVGACAAIREGWEYPYIIRNMHKYIQFGLSPEISMLMAQSISKNGKSLGGQADGHTTFGENIPLSAIQAFKDADYVATNHVPAKQDARSYRGINDLFCRGTDPTFIATFKKYTTVTGTGWSQIYKFDAFSPEVINHLKELDK